MQQGTVNSGGGITNAVYSGPTGSQADTAVAFVFKQLGCPYSYGSTGPCSVGFDCSGLVIEAWAAAGITIPRDTYSQWAALPHISESAAPTGRPAVLQRHRPRRDVRRRRHDHRRAIGGPAGPRAQHEHRLVLEQLRRRRPAVTSPGDDPAGDQCYVGNVIERGADRRKRHSGSATSASRCLVCARDA